MSLIPNKPEPIKQETGENNLISFNVENLSSPDVRIFEVINKNPFNVEYNINISGTNITTQGPTSGILNLEPNAVAEFQVKNADDANYSGEINLEIVDGQQQEPDQDSPFQSQSL